jgi:hypothetical protein
MSELQPVIGQLSEALAGLSTKRKSPDDESNPPKKTRGKFGPKPSAANAQQQATRQRNRLNTITQQNMKNAFDSVSIATHKYVFSEQVTCPGRLFSFETPHLLKIIDHLSQTINDLPSFRSKLPNLTTGMISASYKVAVSDYILMKLYLSRRGMALTSAESQSTISTLWRTIEPTVRHSTEDGVAFPSPLMDLLNMIGHFTIFGRPQNHYPEPRDTATSEDFWFRAPLIQAFTCYTLDGAVQSVLIPQARVIEAYATLPFYQQYGGVAIINNVAAYYQEDGTADPTCIAVARANLTANQPVYLHVSYMGRVDAYKNIRSICRLLPLNLTKVVYGEVSGQGTPGQLACVRGEEFKSEFADINAFDLVMGAYMFDATTPYPHEKLDASLRASCAKMTFNLFLSKLDGKLQST